MDASRNRRLDRGIHCRDHLGEPGRHRCPWAVGVNPCERDRWCRGLNALPTRNASKPLGEPTGENLRPVKFCWLSRASESLRPFDRAVTAPIMALKEWWQPGADLLRFHRGAD